MPSNTKPKTKTTRITNLNRDAMRKILSSLPMRNKTRVAAATKNLRAVAKPAANANKKRAVSAVGKVFESQNKFVPRLRSVLAAIKAGLETRIAGGAAGLGWEELDDITYDRMEALIPDMSEMERVDDSVYITTDDPYRGFSDTQFEVTLEPFVAGRRVHTFPCKLSAASKGGPVSAERAIVVFSPRFDTAKGTWNVLTWTPKTFRLANGAKHAKPSSYGYRIAGALRVAADDVFKRANRVKSLAAQAARVSATAKLAPPKRKRPAPSSASAKKSPSSAAKKSATARGPTAKKARAPLPNLKLWGTYPIGSWVKKR